jgi:hypothetical protein
MNQLSSTSTKLSSVSIRKAAPRNVLSDAYEDEKVRYPAIAVEALRTISRIVQAIKKKIEAEETNPGDDPTRNPSSSTTTSPDRGQDNSPESVEIDAE